MSGDICRLCQKPAILLQSHVLPEFFYASVYDDLHRTMLLTSDEKDRLIQKGLRERLLCQNCETQFSRYEGYAVNIIKTIHEFKKDSSGKFSYTNDIDYKTFKLFQLSLLWRSSVAQGKMFANVSLAKHEEILRVMLLNENPGKSTDYGCFIVRMPEVQKINKIIMPPVRERLFGHNGIRFMLGDLFWYFMTTSHSVRKDVSFLFLQEDGTLRVWDAPWKEQQVYTNIGKLFQARKRDLL